MVNISYDDISKLIPDLKIINEYFQIGIRKILNKEVLFSCQARTYDASVIESKILLYLEIIEKYGNLDQDLKDLQEIEEIKKDLTVRFQKIDEELMTIVKKIHKLRHEALILAEKESFFKKCHLKRINKRLDILNNKILTLTKSEKELFEQGFVSKEDVINNLINKYIINVNDINDNNDLRIIERVREEISFFNSGNFYKSLIEQVDANVKSLEIGHLDNPLEKLDSFIFYTKGLVIACQPKLKKVKDALKDLYKSYPEYISYSMEQLKTKYDKTVVVLDAIGRIVDNLSLLTNVLSDRVSLTRLIEEIESRC